MANPDPQTHIDNLNETYTSLTQKLRTQMSAAEYSETAQKLDVVRKEIEYWEDRRDRATRAAQSFTQARPVR